MTNFIHDKEKMADFNSLTKEEFLRSYSYLTEDDYDSTKIAKRIDEIREEIHNERISYGEIAELQELSEYIDPTDTEPLQWANVCEQHNILNHNCDN